MSQQDTVEERVQELTWAMVDGEIGHDDVELLESLLLSDEHARSTYLNCVQLHADLVGHFADRNPPQEASTPPILSFLGGGSPTVDVQPST